MNTFKINAEWEDVRQFLIDEIDSETHRATQIVRCSEGVFLKTIDDRVKVKFSNKFELNRQVPSEMSLKTSRNFASAGNARLF